MWLGPGVYRGRERWSDGVQIWPHLPTMEEEPEAEKSCLSARQSNFKTGSVDDFTGAGGQRGGGMK